MHDLITVGRANMDLYSRDVGADFADITSFDASVGGSPTNIAIAGSRLGLTAVAFTAVGDDAVGDWVLRYLRDERVNTDYVPRKPGRPTSLALLGVQPPDHFPLLFYRQDPADIHLTVEDAEQLPFAQSRALLLSGNAFSRGSCVEAARLCAEAARTHGLVTFLDLDLRPSDWSHPRAYGLTLRTVLPFVDVLIGTEEECFAMLASDPEPVMDGRRLTDAQRAHVDDLLAGLGSDGTVTTVVKRGPGGVTVRHGDERLDVDGFRVAVVNTVGAGDAFAAGLLRSRLAGLEWHDAARFANACGALVVGRHGCSAAFPTAAEVHAFLSAHTEV